MVIPSRRFTRRAVMLKGGVSLLGLSLLSACGGGTGAPAATTAPTASSAATSAPSSAASGSPPASAPAASPAAAPASSTAVVHVGGDEPVPGPDPATDVSGSGFYINHNVYDQLVAYDWSASKVAPRLAASWESSADSMTWTFKLDPNAKFPSGRPITGSDVQWSLNRTLAINDSSNAGYLRTAIDEHSVTAPDDHSVQINLAKKYAGFLALLTMNAASVLDQQVITPNVQGNDYGQAWLRQHSAGSGPFVLDQWQRGQQLVMKRNDAYWGSPAKIAEWDILVVKEAAQQAMMLQGGDLDVAISLLPDELKSLATTKGFGVAKGTLLSPYYLAMNMTMAPFDDVRVRQAVRLALNNETTIQDLLGGNAVPIGGIIAPGLLGYDPSLVVTRDVAQAKQLLAQAGHPSGFSVEMRFQSAAIAGVGVPQSDLAAKVQADLAEVGIQLKLTAQDPATLLTFYRAGKSPLTMWYWGPTYPDPDVIISTHGDKTTNGSQRVGFEDDEITTLIQDARVEFDPAKREALYKQAQQLTAQRGPYAFMFVPKALQGVSDKVQHYTIDPIWNADMWTVTKS